MDTDIKIKRKRSETTAFMSTFFWEENRNTYCIQLQQTKEQFYFILY